MQRSVAIMLLTIVALGGCEFIPGTDQQLQRRAREAAAELLIDPSSALFRNIINREGVVCGEINGKNRMGAYVGYLRFLVDTSSWEASLEPQSDTLSDSVDTELFGSMWRARCGDRAGATPQLGFDGSSLSNDLDLPNAATGIDAPTEAAETASEPTEPIYLEPQGTSAADGSPYNAPVDTSASSPPAPEPAAPVVERNEDANADGNQIDRQWLDRALGRRPAPKPTPDD